MRSIFVRAACVVVLAVCAGGAPAAAQVTGTLKVGVVATRFSGDANLDFTPKVGWTGGLGLGYDFGNGLTLVPELFYIRKGAHADATVADLNTLLGYTPDPGDDAIPVDLTWDVAYLDVPVVLSYRFTTRSRYHPRLSAGPSFGYQLSASIRYADETAEFTASDPTIGQYDLGFVVGAGVEIETGSERLLIDLRALIGRSDIRERPPALRNSGLTLTAGLVF